MRARGTGRTARGATCAALAFAASCVASPIAQAQPPRPQSGFNVNTFTPSARGSDWFVLDSLDLRSDARGAIGVVGQYANEPLGVRNPDGSERATIITHQLYVHPGASLVILDRLRLAVDVPIAAYNDGDRAVLGAYVFQGPTRSAVGDASFAGDLRLFGTFGQVATGAIGVQAIAPTGFRALYTGDGATRIAPRLQLAGLVKHVEWAARLGLQFRTADDPVGTQPRGQAFVFGVALGWRTPDSKLVVGPELYGSASLTQPSAANTPMEALFGAHYAFAGHEWRVGVAAGPGLTAGLGTPIVRTVLSLEYVAAPEEDAPKKVARHREPADRDRDGVPDTLDACPDTRGPETDDAATNGCPPPPDTDGDAIADNVDACPDEPGSPNADPEANGCPPDADNDGVPDAVDACPLRAGVEQTDPTQTGCPPDSDRDGIIDAEDACPDVQGARSSDPQENGCPLDPDRDHDGIPNAADACPGEAGAKDPEPRKNGCPRAILRGSEIRILDQVRFEANSARIARTPSATGAPDILGAVAKVMIDHPEIKKLEVQGHTDNRGDPKANKKLSEQRADAVVKALVAQGLDASRFTAVGYGDERPLDTNVTEAGRKANRRVELHVIETTKAVPR